MKYYLSYPFGGNFSFLDELDDDVPISVDNINDADIVIFTGGPDINPKLYGHPKSAITHTYETRDHQEIAIYKTAIKKGLPILGICRGLQLINAMQGGTLIQNLDSHTGSKHEVIDDNTKAIYLVNSIHHQAVVPPKDGAIVLAYTKERLSKKYLYGNPLQYLDAHATNFKEIEAVYYPGINALGIQWHPELDKTSSGSNLLARNYLNEYIRGTL